MVDVIIVGGGITGLSAAWDMQHSRPNLSYALLEASAYWGGKIVSQVMQVQGHQFLVDGGPDTLVTRKPETWTLVEEVGLINEVTSPVSETKNIYVLDNGALCPIPLSPALFFTTPLLTWKGRLRLLSEPFQPARRDDRDESLADFVTRRLGKEALEKFVGPVLGGIYNTDPDQQSILVTAPIMREMEKESGSLVLASMKRMLRNKPGVKKPRFINFKRGMQQLPNQIASLLQGDLRLNARVVRIEPTGGGYSAVLASGERIEAKVVILATLANVSATLLRELTPQAATLLAHIDHENSGTISLVFRQGDLPTQPLVNGLMIPRREKRAIDALTVTSRKMPERSHPGFDVLRVFFGGSRPGLVNDSDEKLVQTVSAELRHLIGIHADPLAYTVFRWESGFPQCRVDHLKRVDAMEACLPKGIFLAGSSYRGVAVPDCVRQGREAARQAIAIL